MTRQPPDAEMTVLFVGLPEADVTACAVLLAGMTMQRALTASSTVARMSLSRPLVVIVGRDLARDDRSKTAART